MRTVYTGGTFDLIHPGHVHLLAECRELAGKGGKVVVALNPDDFVERYKGHAPVMRYADRAAVLRAIRYVDEVVPNLSGADSRPTIEMVRPDIIAIGADWLGRDYYAQMGFTQRWLDEREISLIYVPLLHYAPAEGGHVPHSSTGLRATARLVPHG